MADKKINSAVFISGRRFMPENAQDAEDLDAVLTPEAVERLQNEEPPVIEGFTGRAEATNLTVPAPAEGPPRPTGTEKDEDGEPIRPHLSEEQPEPTPAKATPKKVRQAGSPDPKAASQPWAKPK